MSGKYIFLSFLTVMTAIVLIVGFGVLAVAFGLRNPDAFAVLAAAITGLAMVASRLVPDRDRNE